ncbi:MAG: J domain-containing protein [Defluviicoccus sp.]
MRGSGKSRLYREWPGATPTPPRGQVCEWPGCANAAAYPAPRSRSHLKDYFWYCLDHVRVYNATWNYYAGMSDAEVEADVRADTVWQRPSWRLGTEPAAGVRERLHDSFGILGDEPLVPPARPPTEEERALLILDLRPPVTLAIVKAQYKILVKKYHPDATGGDKAAEERFKEISEAYRKIVRALEG